MPGFLGAAVGAGASFQRLPGFVLAPSFFGLAFHGRRFRVFDLDSKRPPAGAIRRAKPLGHNALAAELAGVLENDFAVALVVLIEHDAESLVWQQDRWPVQLIPRTLRLGLASNPSARACDHVQRWSQPSNYQYTYKSAQVWHGGAWTKLLRRARKGRVGPLESALLCCASLLPTLSCSPMSLHLTPQPFSSPIWVTAVSGAVESSVSTPRVGAF